MRIAYISSASYTDLDLSFVNAIQKYVDVDYYILMNHKGRRQTALDLSKNDNLKDGINKATDVPELKQFQGMIDLDKTFIIYSTYSHQSSLKAQKQSLSFSKHLLKKNYDVIHITRAPSIDSLFLYRLKKKIVITVHDPFPHSNVKNKIEIKLRELSYKLLNNFILLNKAQKSAFVETYNMQSKRIFDSSLSCYNYLKAYDDVLELPEKYILFFGNINSYKGVEYLLEAMKKVHPSAPDYKLIVAGKGSFSIDISEYQKLDYIDIRNRFIPNDELASLIRHSTVVVLPYIDATQSGVIMSAYAFNKPCVVTNVGGLPEMVGNGELGVIVEPKDINSLANGIVDCLNNKSQLEIFAHRIKELYQMGELSWRCIAQQHFSFYNQIK